MSTIFKIGSEASIPSGTPVRVTIRDDEVIVGKVVGKASNDITQSHIITCTDGQLPNEHYKYDTFIVGLPLIEILEG